MTVPNPITALRAVRDMLVNEADAAMLPVAVAIDNWLMTGGDFATALGLAPGWHSALRQWQRDATVGELARHFSGICGRPLARAMTAAAADYETRRWPRDRATRRRPDGMDGLFFDLLSMGGIPSEHTLRKCIGYS
jgi:hypothetical protein